MLGYRKITADAAAEELDAATMVVGMIETPAAAERAAELAAVEGLDCLMVGTNDLRVALAARSEAHTSELQSLMRISYAVFCLKKKTSYNNNITSNISRYNVLDLYYIHIISS